jgi:DNA-binding NarL/FixJ family response regulator
MPSSPAANAVPADQTISVLIADDHPAIRSGLRSLLSQEPDLDVRDDVASGEAAYVAYRRDKPTLVLMDLSMQGYGGIEASRRILNFDPEARILVYTVHDSEVMLRRALALGALGYVTKGSPMDELLRGIREVARDRGFVSPDMLPVMVRVNRGEHATRLAELGAREFQILLMIAQGKQVGDCARELNLSEKTVRNHLTRIKSKLHVANLAELARLAIREGLIDA